MAPRNSPNEAELIAGLARSARRAGAAPRGLVLGIGDDAAAIRGGNEDFLITQDALVEGRHFRREWMTSATIGRRAAAVNLSDIAAMGASPRYALVSLFIPDGEEAAFVRGVERGVVAHCAQYGAAVVGGNVTATSGPFAVDVTLIGTCARGRAWRRWARAGDFIVVAGELGQAALGLAMLRDNARARGKAVGAYLRPVARLDVASGLAGERGVRGAIDVSDGLSTDLLHLCRTSGVGCDVDACALGVSRALHAYGKMHALDPVDWILRGGDDYALLLAVAPRRVRAVCAAVAALDVPVSCIGRFTTRRNGCRLRRADGSKQRIVPSGWDHLR